MWFWFWSGLGWLAYLVLLSSAALPFFFLWKKKVSTGSDCRFRAGRGGEQNGLLPFPLWPIVCWWGPERQIYTWSFSSSSVILTDEFTIVIIFMFMMQDPFINARKCWEKSGWWNYFETIEKNNSHKYSFSIYGKHYKWSSPKSWSWFWRGKRNLPCQGILFLHASSLLHFYYNYELVC